MGKGANCSALALILGVAAVVSAQQLSRVASSETQAPVPGGKSHESLLDIDPKCTVRELVPPPPPELLPLEPYLEDDLAAVPEVALEESQPHRPAWGTGAVPIARLVARANFLNRKEPDGFIKALMTYREDIQGLPFVTGKECRADLQRGGEFKKALVKIRQAQNDASPYSTNYFGPNPTPAQLAAARFWKVLDSDWRWMAPCDGSVRTEREQSAQVAAVTQVVGPESATMRAGLVSHLHTIPHPAAAQALARLALFSPERHIRKGAVEALQNRPRIDYTDMLLQGLRYPWPPVVRRAAEALVHIGRRDLVPCLIDLLDEPDPLDLEAVSGGGRTVYILRQLVRVNHHRNCLLCHAPAGTDKIPDDVEIAPIPNPTRPLPLPDASGSYSASSPASVRIDVTFLRQDFSARLQVADADPWPEMQRYDFLVRRVVLSPNQAEAYEIKRREMTGSVSPQRQAILYALFKLTGRDAGAAAADWREMLKSSK